MTSEPVERRTKVWLGAAAFVVVGLVAGVASLRRAHPERTAWPDPSAPLVVAPLSLPPAFGTRRIFLDAGHGAPNNPGNTSALCEREQDFTRSLARDVAAAYRLWGKGVHPAGLNFGDCFAYACAKGYRAALLYKGDDFAKTDLA